MSVSAKLLRWMWKAFLAMIVAIVLLWTSGAAYFDGPSKPLAVALTILVLAVLIFARPWWRKALMFAGWFVPVVVWWLTLKPSNYRDWQPDVAQTAWAEIKDDEVTLHNVRNCDYRSATDYTPRWETRTVRLSQITGIDMAICYWGSPYMAHPIVSFQFADAPPLCFSIEARKEAGEKYSALGGFYRRFELIYLVADERDVIRLRTNHREGEDVYLYRLTITPDKARVRFMDYITAINELREQPRWYNAATTNCTTSIRAQHDPAKRMPWDWRILVNGKGDEMMFERGVLETGGLPFPELRAHARINDAARLDGGSVDFSRRIRDGRAGIADLPAPAL